MCFQVAKGIKNLSDLAFFRLEEAERAAGISPPIEPIIRPQTPAPEPSAGMQKEKDEISFLGRKERLRGLVARRVHEQVTAPLRVTIDRREVDYAEGPIRRVVDEHIRVEGGAAPLTPDP